MTPTEKEAVLKFIDSNIKVVGFPSITSLQEDGQYQHCNVVINVSDEFYIGNSESQMVLGKLGYYFPLGEQNTDMGVVSIFGALQVLYSIYKFNPEWIVLIHCQAGKNRSPTVRAAFYYMMLGEHEPDRTTQGGRNNRLLDNCSRGHLPELAKMESFLSYCKEAFDNPEKFIGGMLDWVMGKAELDKFKTKSNDNSN